MLAYLFVVLAVVVRLLPKPVEWLAFTPVAASLLFFGAKAPRKRMWIPLLLLAASDVYLSKVVYAYPLSADLLVTWSWYAGILLLGGLLRSNANPLRLAGASLTASISFFLVSNFAVWALWNMYPKTLAGLGTAYVAAIPFFRNPVVADLMFTAVMFGSAALLERRESKVAAGRITPA